MAFNFLNELIHPTDDEYEDYDDYETSKPTPEVAPENNKKVMSLVNHASEKKIMLFEPRIFSDVKGISQRLLNGQAAVVNFQRIDDAQAHRVIDFLSGVTFAINGKISRVGEKIFLCTPEDFVVEGDLTDMRKEDGFEMRGV
ncbi:cell division inhibitor SepF [Ligilactobacillus sp. WC1T17]|uniref:Cell division protein SepF n=1 Tax=Ligilactobacillus ruminis TaxID=1623 RepID=A0ABY1AAW5_9LACO|nr:cell division inhibitor SepF [Ligilactobacillus ruminis]